MRKGKKEKMDLVKFKEILNTLPGFNRWNNIRFTVLEEGYCECQVELTQDGRNPQGVAHGSLLFQLCDCVTGAASASFGRNMLTQSASIHYLRPAATGLLTAKSRLIRVGRRTALFGAEVYDDRDRLLCTGEFEIFYTGGDVKWEETGTGPLLEPVK